jgi:hypothetical protein
MQGIFLGNAGHIPFRGDAGHSLFTLKARSSSALDTAQFILDKAESAVLLCPLEIHGINVSILSIGWSLHCNNGFPPNSPIYFQ